ncbi:MAG TPA: hypothetical protein VJP59_07055 [Gemmatimonadota bacterium]|nr:hypothetical protein [Gemmatimonadota bacterium]
MLFLGLGLATTSLPREPFRERIRQAFADGALVEEDWLPFDAWRGSHQYDECVIFQMLANPAELGLADALGPTAYSLDETYSQKCLTLHRLVVERVDPSVMLSSRYTRYWHGTMPVAAGLLLAMDLESSRKVLKAAAYGALLLLLGLALLSTTGPPRWVGSSAALCGLLFWGLPYFGQAFSRAPGDILVVLGLCGLLVWRRGLDDRTRLVPYACAFGAGIAYLEFLTGQLPTAGGFMFAFAYALKLRSGTKSRRSAWIHAGVGLVAFALGAGVTVALKQVLALAVLGTEGLEAFAGNLRLYLQPAVSDEYSLPGFLLPLGRFFRQGVALTHGSAAGATLLFLLSTLAWVVASGLALARALRGPRSLAAVSDQLALLTGAAVVFAWIFLFQHHTFIHASMMVRISIVPIALGWAALVWQLQSGPGRGYGATTPTA